MDFKEFYKEFEAAVKEDLSAALWDKALVKANPEAFAKELFDSDMGFTAEEAAEEFVDMIHVMKDQGEFNEAHSCPFRPTHEVRGDSESFKKHGHKSGAKSEGLESFIDEVATMAADLPKKDWTSYEKLKDVFVPKYQDVIPYDTIISVIVSALDV